MDVKEAKIISDKMKAAIRGDIIPVPKDHNDIYRAEGFLDAIDQLKATEIKETAHEALLHLPYAHPAARDLKKALAKLSALLGEK